MSSSPDFQDAPQKHNDQTPGGLHLEAFACIVTIVFEPCPPRNDMRMICRLFCLLIFITFCVAAQAAALEIPLEKHGDVYTLPVLVNGSITVNFILDTGASEVVIPSNYVTTLLRAGTITQNDFLPGKSYRLGNGSVMRSSRFKIKELNIRGYRIFDVPACVSPVTGPPLLGQSFLNRIESWTLDNRSHKLILSGPEPKQPTTAITDSQRLPEPDKRKAAHNNDRTAAPGADGQPKPLDTPVTEKTGTSKSSRPLIPPSAHHDVQGQSTIDGPKPLIPPSVQY